MMELNGRKRLSRQPNSACQSEKLTEEPMQPMHIRSIFGIHRSDDMQRHATTCNDALTQCTVNLYLHYSALLHIYTFLLNVFPLYLLYLLVVVCSFQAFLRNQKWHKMRPSRISKIYDKSVLPFFIHRGSNSALDVWQLGWGLHRFSSGTVDCVLGSNFWSPHRQYGAGVRCTGNDSRILNAKAERCTGYHRVDLNPFAVCFVAW